MGRIKVTHILSYKTPESKGKRIEWLASSKSQAEKRKENLKKGYSTAKDFRISRVKSRIIRF